MTHWSGYACKSPGASPRVSFCLAMVVSVAVLISVAGHVSAQEEPVEFEDPVDQFAAGILNEAQGPSFRDNKEYCGLIGYDRTGKLLATSPKPGFADGCRPDDNPDIISVIASYHTHGRFSWDADTELPSVADLEADFDEEIDGYVATPGGRFWVTDRHERGTFLLCGPGCLKTDPRYEACPCAEPLDFYSLSQLRERESRPLDPC